MALNQLKMRDKTDHLVPFEVPRNPFSSLISAFWVPRTFVDSSKKTANIAAKTPSRRSRKPFPITKRVHVTVPQKWVRARYG